MLPFLKKSVQAEELHVLYLRTKIAAKASKTQWDEALSVCRTGLRIYPENINLKGM